MSDHVDIRDGTPNAAEPVAKLKVNPDGSILVRPGSGVTADSLAAFILYGPQLQEHTQLLRLILAELQNIATITGGMPATPDSP